jgi:hypothetical protein
MTSTQIVNVDIDNLAKYIFKTNVDSQMFLQFDSIKTNRDLFYLCFDLFCKGIVLLFGKDNKFRLNDMNDNHFDKIRRKLLFANIDTKIVQYPIDTAILIDILDPSRSPKQVLSDSINKIGSLETNLEIEEYEFSLLIDSVYIIISFGIK